MKQYLKWKKWLMFVLAVVLMTSGLGFSAPETKAAGKMAITPKKVRMVIGANKTVKIKNLPRGAKVSCKSNSPKIAKVSKKGKITGKKSGKAKITVIVKENGRKKKFFCMVTVKKPTLSEKSITVNTGNSVTLSIKNAPAKAAKTKYTWTSDNPRVANVKNGKVTGIAEGTTYIRIKMKSGRMFSYSEKCKVVVKKGKQDVMQPERITLDKSSIELETGKEVILKASILPDNAKDKTVLWSSSDISVATVRNGKVTGVNQGNAVITAQTVNGKIAKCQVKVNLSQFDKFSMAAAEMIRNAGEIPDAGTIPDFGTSQDRMYASKRLIIRGNDRNLSFREFDPVAEVKSGEGLYLVQFESAQKAREAAEVISGWPEVQWVEPDEYIYIDPQTDEAAETEEVPVNSAEAKSWGVSIIGADKYASRLSSSQNSTTVAVIDTGVAGHAFLNGRVLRGGWDFIDADANPEDEHYHGTHVAGTIVDCTPGLPINILPIRVLDSRGRGSSAGVALGIRYAADHGAKVINMSLGGGHSNLNDEAVAYAISKGVSVVVAAGNENMDTDNCCPAHIKEAIVVAAVERNSKKATFSNFGSSVDVAAPGVDIVSCVPGGGYKSLNGTSMATPHVAAVAAMFRLEYPDMTPAQTEEWIEENTKDLGSVGWDPFYGFGIPDLKQAAERFPQSIALNKSKLTLAQGSTETLTAVILPENAGNKTISWSSSAPSVVTVDRGTVKAAGLGTAVITARTSNGLTATCQVTSVKQMDEKDLWRYTSNKDGTGVTLIEYLGNEIDVVIPSFIQGKPVTELSRPFNNHLEVRSVTVSKGIRDISYAFNGCISLEEVNLPNTIEDMGGAFGDCTSLKEITLSGEIKEMKYAFDGCTSLTSVTFKGGRVELPDSIFEECSALERVYSDAEITGIGKYAFDGCGALREVYLEKVSGEIAQWAFRDCGALESVCVLGGEYSIGLQAFSGCRSLKNLTLGSGITQIGNAAFENCISLSELALPEGLVSIEGRAFSGCVGLTDLFLPKGLTRIGEYAFQDCSLLRTASIPEGIETLDGTFYKCTALEKVFLPDSLREMRGVFCDCISLKALKLPENLVLIGDRCFQNCRVLEGLSIPESVTEIGDWAFADCFKFKKLILPPGLKVVSSGMINGCEGIRELDIPEGTESIEDYAFWNCPALEYLRIPESVTTIEEAACPNAPELLVIEGAAGSAAETYARERNIPFEAIDTDL